MKTAAEFRRSRRARECRHFKPLVLGEKSAEPPTCHRSVVYPTPHLPCFTPGACPLFEARTAEELDKQEQALLLRLERLGKAADAVDAAVKRGGDSPIPCPICGTGKLHFRVSKYNGHVHAACSTAGCVAWME